MLIAVTHFFLTVTYFILPWHLILSQRQQGINIFSFFFFPLLFNLFLYSFFTFLSLLYLFIYFLHRFFPFFFFFSNFLFFFSFFSSSSITSSSSLFLLLFPPPPFPFLSFPFFFHLISSHLFSPSSYISSLPLLTSFLSLFFHLLSHHSCHGRMVSADIVDIIERIQPSLREASCHDIICALCNLASSKECRQYLVDQGKN